MGIQSTKLIRAGVATTLFVVLLACVYVVHAWFLPVDVVFYSAVADGALAAVLASGALWTLRWFEPLGTFEKCQLGAIWLLLGYAFAISVPTVIDRSLSFYLLEKLQQRGGGIRQDAIAGIFVNEYMREHRLVDVRMTEQLASGTIVIENDCVLLTAKGRRMASFSRAVREYLLPRRRLLMGTYSDALTDLYRDSPRDADYRCEGSATARNEPP